MCAALTKPWVCPPLNQQANQKLPQNFQSIGARGIMTMEGKMLTALWPTDRPWFRMELAGEVEFDPEADPAKIQDTKARLFLRELVVQAKIDYSWYFGAGFLHTSVGHLVSPAVRLS